MATRKKKGKKATSKAQVSIRHYLPEDANLIVTAAEAIRALDPEAPLLDAPRWRFVCADPYADCETHFRVAETEEGEVVGFSYRFDPPRVDGGTYRAVYVVVHPDHRRMGLGTRLLKETLGKAVDASVDPGWYATTTVEETSIHGRRFATKLGFKKGFTRLMMERELPGRPVLGENPPDVKFERFVGASAYADWASIHNEAYAGQPDAIRHDPAELERTRAEDFRPDHVRFIKIERERVAYLYLRESSDGGYIESIAVKPKFRGRGLATALARTAIAYFTERGHTVVSLMVDDRNDPALKLYRRLDFEEVGERHYLVRKKR